MSDRSWHELAGKSALVTGASRGIGLAAAKKLAKEGVMVALAARSQQILEQHVADITVDGGRAIAIGCDVTAYHDVETAVEATCAAFGKIDILINNAGVIEPISPIDSSDPMAWSQALDVNVKGVYHGIRAVLPIMLRQQAGVIVNLSSGAANSALEGWSHYCAAKAAVKKLTECAHAETQATPVRVVGLSPGTVATDMMATIRDSGINPVSQLDWSTHSPPEWAAEAVAYLCLDEAQEFDGSDFSLKTEEGRRRVGLPAV